MFASITQEQWARVTAPVKKTILNLTLSGKQLLKMFSHYSTIKKVNTSLAWKQTQSVELEQEV